MPSKGMGIGAVGTALAFLFTTINPSFNELEALFKRRYQNSRQITLVNEANAAERRLEDTIKFEVSGKRYSVQKNDSGKYLVFDDSGNFVEKEDIAQKAIFSRLVYDMEISKLERLPWKPLYKTYFKIGEFAQYAKNALALILFGNYRILSAAVEGGKEGSKGVLVEILKELSKEVIIETGKKIVGHPEAVSKGIAIESYEEGYRAWVDNLSIIKALERSKPLKYEDADRFLYNSSVAKTLMPASNKLTSDIASGKYDPSINAAVANYVFTLLGRNINSLKQGDIIEEVVRALNQSLGQYPPFQRFAKSVEAGVIDYIKRKVRLDEMALSLIGEKPPIQTGQGRYGNGLIAFASNIGGKRPNIYAINLNNGDLISLTDSQFNHSSPDWSFDGKSLVFISDRHELFGPPEVYLIDDIVNALSNVRRVTSNQLWEDEVVFSSDKKYVVYSARTYTRNGLNISFRQNERLYIKKADGSGREERLTNNNCREMHPSFSRHNKLAYLCIRGNLYQTVIMDFKTREEISRIGIPHDGVVTISPGGNEILVLGLGKSNKKYVINIRDRSRKDFDIMGLQKSIEFYRATWGPDERIAFITYQDSILYSVGKDGRDLKLIHQTGKWGVDTGFPSWQPIPLIPKAAR